MPVENPIPDWTDVVRDRDFIGLAWVPTVCLRFVEREVTEHIRPHERTSHKVRVLQQMWETAVMNQSGRLVEIENPCLHEWRDIPVVEEV